MSVPLYMDVHVKSAITNALRQRGIDVLTAQEDDHGNTSDVDLLQRANTLGRLMFTQDDDFLVIAQEWQTSGRPFAGIVKLVFLTARPLTPLMFPSLSIRLMLKRKWSRTKACWSTSTTSRRCSKTIGRHQCHVGP